MVGPGSPSTCCLHSRWTDLLRSGQFNISEQKQKLSNFLGFATRKPVYDHDLICRRLPNCTKNDEAITGHGGAEARALKMALALEAVRCNVTLRYAT